MKKIASFQGFLEISRQSWSGEILLCSHLAGVQTGSPIPHSFKVQADYNIKPGPQEVHRALKQIRHSGQTMELQRHVIPSGPK